MAKLIEQRYGKAQVQALKILGNGPVHTIREIEVSALFAGDVATFYAAGDSAKGVPTDTIKNTADPRRRLYRNDRQSPKNATGF